MLFGKLLIDHTLFRFPCTFFLTNVFSVAGRDRWIYGWSFAAI